MNEDRVDNYIQRIEDIEGAWAARPHPESKADIFCQTTEDLEEICSEVGLELISSTPLVATETGLVNISEDGAESGSDRVDRGILANMIQDNFEVSFEEASALADAALESDWQDDYR